jgi:hypothetical protein
MGDDSAVDELIRRAADPAISSESLRDAIGPALEPLSPDDRPGAEAVLRRLAEEIIDAPTRPDVAGTIALCCGALVESGLDPTVALGPILDRLERQIAPDAIAFVAACRPAAEDEPPPSPPEGDETEQEGDDRERTDPVERHGERIAALMPTGAQSFHALEPFSLAAIAMLARSAEARKASWSRTALRASLDELGGQYGYAGLLWVMMRVLDDEPLVVLHPEQGKGYRVRISGLADNFQLHTLLADALIGRFSRRWLRGRRPGQAAVAAASDGPIREGAPHTRGAFTLWTWRGLKPDGTLRDPRSGSAHRIGNEGVPADIPPFEGLRVVLLGPPPCERSWSPNRKFPALVGDLRVERILTPDEIRDLLGRISGAAAAG